MKKIQYIPVLAVLLLMASCGNNKNTFDATGAFEATEVIVSSEANGRIMQLEVEEGNKLTAGTPIGYVDSTQLYLRKMQLIAGQKSVETRKPDIRKQIAALEQQIATARTEQYRMENLVKANSANQKQVDDIVEGIKLLQKQWEAQHSALAKTTSGADKEAEGFEYQVMQLDDQLGKCHLINPVTGTILVKYAEAHEITSVGKPLYKIANMETLFLRAYITAEQLSQLKLNQPVTVFADFGKDNRREYPGIITWISDKSEFTPKGIQTKDERANLVYAIKIAVKNDGYLKIGQYGEVVF